MPAILSYSALYTSIDKILNNNNNTRVHVVKRQILVKLHEGNVYLSEDDVLSVEPSCLGKEDEELGVVGVRTVVGHAYPALKKENVK